VWTAAPATLVEVTPSSPVAMTMVVEAPVPPPVMRVIPYVAPYHKPKPERN
jgi:hypothetical protein